MSISFGLDEKSACKGSYPKLEAFNRTLKWRCVCVRESFMNLRVFYQVNYIHIRIVNGKAKKCNFNGTSGSK